MESATVLPLFYRRGAVSTGVDIGALDATAAHDSIDVRTTLTRTGNGAFIGVAHLIVRDSSGRTIASVDRPLAVYRSMRPRWSIAVPPGAAMRGCSVTLQLSTRRRDVPGNLLLQSASNESVVAMVRDAQR